MSEKISLDSSDFLQLFGNLTLLLKNLKILAN